MSQMIPKTLTLFPTPSALFFQVIASTVSHATENVYAILKPVETVQLSWCAPLRRFVVQIWAFVVMHLLEPDGSFFQTEDLQFPTMCQTKDLSIIISFQIISNWLNLFKVNVSQQTSDKHWTRLRLLVESSTNYHRQNCQRRVLLVSARTSSFSNGNRHCKSQRTIRTRSTRGRNEHRKIQIDPRTSCPRSGRRSWPRRQWVLYARCWRNRYNQQRGLHAF